MSENTPQTFYLNAGENREDWSFVWTHATGDTSSYLARHYGIPDSEQKTLVLKPIFLKQLLNASLQDAGLKSAQDVFIDGLKRAGDTSVSKKELWQRFLDLEEDQATALAQSALDALLRHAAAEASTARPALSRRAVAGGLLAASALGAISVGTAIAFNSGRDKKRRTDSEPTADSAGQPSGVIKDFNAEGKVVPAAAGEIDSR